MSLLQRFVSRLIMALCLAGGLASLSVEPVAAAPISGLTRADMAEPANPVAQIYWRRHAHRHYVVRRYYRPVHRIYYRPIGIPICRRYVGWHMTRFGMIYGPYNRCYRR